MQRAKQWHTAEASLITPHANKQFMLFPERIKAHKPKQPGPKQMSMIYTLPHTPHPPRAISTETDPGKAHKRTPGPCPCQGRAS